MCRLPPESVIYVVKDGFRMKTLGPLDWSQSVQHNITMERE